MSKTIYYIYHIPGNKIGITCNINNRLTEQQGYEPHEFEVLDSSTDIDYISKLELELQKVYGYPVDEHNYKQMLELKNQERSMKGITSTKITTTLPTSIGNLESYLKSSIGEKWTPPEHETVFEIKQDNINWFLTNCVPSKYRATECYIYNKAYVANVTGGNAVEEPSVKLNDSNVTLSDIIKAINPSRRFELIRAWAEDRGIYEKGDQKTQYVKLMEEAGELGRAILKKDTPEIKDAIGDMVVVLTNLAKLSNMTIEDCIDSAYEVISKRKGVMENGTFVKQTL